MLVFNGARFLSTVAEGPRTRVVNFCNKLEQESLSSCVTLVVDALAYLCGFLCCPDDDAIVVVDVAEEFCRASPLLEEGRRSDHGDDCHP